MPWYQTKIYLILLCFFNLAICNNQQSFLLQQEPSLRFHDNEPIKLKKGSYQKLIQKWNRLLLNTWKKLSTNISNDLGISPTQLETYLQDESLSKIYFMLKEKELNNSQNTLIHEEDMDPEVLSFIKRTIQKFTTKKISRLFFLHI